MFLAPRLHPMLSRLPPERRRSALREARRTPLDILELVTLAAALIVGVVFVRGGPQGAGDAAISWDAVSMGGIAGGAGFCALVLGLVLFRRTRRGLRHVLEQS